MKKKVLFIVNPVSGGKKKDGVPGLIDKYLNKELFDYEIAYSTLDNPIRTIAQNAMPVFDVLVAVGGDGTVNETASAIAGSTKTLGIVPFGSGNGLARFLKIPMDAAKAIKNINVGNTIIIDAAKLNNQWFFNMAGLGFDAHISEVFSHDKQRGFKAYFQSSVQEISNYRSKNYQIEIDGKLYEREAFMLSFANSSQFGNNAHVAPDASLHDGLLDICIVKPFPVYRLPEMGLRMLTKQVESSKFVEIVRGRSIKVRREEAGPVHLDGEPGIIGPEIEISIIPAILNVIAGATYKP